MKGSVNLKCYIFCTLLYIKIPLTLITCDLVVGSVYCRHCSNISLNIALQVYLMALKSVTLWDI